MRPNVNTGENESLYTINVWISSHVFKHQGVDRWIHVFYKHTRNSGCFAALFLPPAEGYAAFWGHNVAIQASCGFPLWLLCCNHKVWYTTVLYSSNLKSFWVRWENGNKWVVVGWIQFYCAVLYSSGGGGFIFSNYKLQNNNRWELMMSSFSSRY